MAAKWIFPETSPFGVQGRDLSEDNFVLEDRSAFDILMREALQNTLDARAFDNSGPVRVSIQVLSAENFDGEYLRSLVPSEYVARLAAAGGGPLLEIGSSRVIVIEDFGTTGLQGVFNDLNVDGAKENWNAFWFREGEGAKSSGSNGRAGQGKITYYRNSQARAVFGYTVRKSDALHLLMGRGAFRRAYSYNNKKYLRHPFWSTDVAHPMPQMDANEIQRFKKAFHLSRHEEPGLSLVIPYSLEFDSKEAIKTIVAEFFYPIAKGRLEVIVNGVAIKRDNIDSVANSVLTDDVARAKKSAFTKGFRSLVRQVIESEEKGEVLTTLNIGWDKSAVLANENFPEGSVELLKGQLEAGKRISVRCPVTVKPKGKAPISTSFDVHLELPEDLERVEEAYIRRDLLIGSESHLTSSAYLQKARGLTLIEEDALSAFMADAEEPTHLKWNASLTRLAEDYVAPAATVRAVRQAMPRILAFLSGGMNTRDVKALAKYFNKPLEDGRKHSSAGKNIGDKTTGDDKPPPPPQRKPFQIDAGIDRVTVLPNGSASPSQSDLPMHCVLELAYEGLDQNPFEEYDPFDFDLSAHKSHPMNGHGIEILERERNKIEFNVTSPEFRLEVAGFDPHIRLRARLNYSEKSDETFVDTE